MTTGDGERTDPDLVTVAIRGVVAAVFAAAANALVLTLVLRGRLVPPFRPLSYPPVVFLSVAGALGAAGVYALLLGRVEDPDRTFLWVAGVVLVASFGPDVALLNGDPAATPAGVAVLMAMHVVVAAIAVGTITDPPDESGEREDRKSDPAR